MANDTLMDHLASKVQKEAYGPACCSCVDNLKELVSLAIRPRAITNFFSNKAVAALWEHQDTEIEAVHLAIALAYHGLLRVPSRAETSDITPCLCLFIL